MQELLIIYLQELLIIHPQELPIIIQESCTQNCISLNNTHPGIIGDVHLMGQCEI